MTEERPVVDLTDPRALRALAHPTRLRLVGLLRREGPLTATAAGARIDESPASCSFHLRQLARWGLVEEAGGGRGRERPWRATARRTHWEAADPEAAAALGATVLEQQLATILRWFERMPDEPSEWQAAHQLGDVQVVLTPEELVEVGQRVWEVISSFDPDRRPTAGRLVTLFFAGVPRGDEP